MADERRFVSVVSIGQCNEGVLLIDWRVDGWEEEAVLEVDDACAAGGG